MIGFLPTIAKQLGYSMTTYGATMTVMSMISMILTPLCAIVVDKFHMNKILFLTSVLGMGVSSGLFIIIPKVPLDRVVEFQWDANKTTFIVSAENNQRTSNDIISEIRINSVESINCKVKLFAYYYIFRYFIL